MLTDTVQDCGALMLRCRAWFLGKGLGGAPLAARGVPCLCDGLLQSKYWMLVHLFSYKQKFSLDCFRLAKIGTYVGERKWYNMSFQKVGNTCISVWMWFHCLDSAFYPVSRLEVGTPGLPIQPSSPLLYQVQAKTFEDNFLVWNKVWHKP